MTLDEVKAAWSANVGKAAFSAHLGAVGDRSPSLHLYPFTDGSGFLWCLWESGDRVEDLRIIAGGRCKATMLAPAAAEAAGYLVEIRRVRG